jgi:hypothetical protein
MLPISFRRLLTILVLSMLAVGGSQTAYAQSNNTANTVGGIVGLFAGIAQAGAKADAQKKWMQVAEPVRACVNVAYSSKGVTLDQIYNEGIAPSDQRIAPVMNFCNATMTRQLRQNFACNVQNSKGQQVTSICSEGFARPVNGSLTAASTEDYITAAMNGEKVQVGVFETGAGRTARGRAERAQEEELARKAEAERQAFLNSPEGKRQAAEQAAQAKAQRKNEILQKSYDVLDCSNAWEISSKYMAFMGNYRLAKDGHGAAEALLSLAIYLAEDAGHSEKTAIALLRAQHDRWADYVKHFRENGFSTTLVNNLNRRNDYCSNWLIKNPDQDILNAKAKHYGK